MGMHLYEYQGLDDEYENNRNVSVSFGSLKSDNGITWIQALEEYTDFLRAIGYVLPFNDSIGNHLDILKDKDINNE
jgi:hypothetical protein